MPSSAFWVLLDSLVLPDPLHLILEERGGGGQAPETPDLHIVGYLRHGRAEHWRWFSCNSLRAVPCGRGDHHLSRMPAKASTKLMSQLPARSLLSVSLFVSNKLIVADQTWCLRAS